MGIMSSSVEHAQGFREAGLGWIWGPSFACVIWSEPLAWETHLIFVGWMIKVKLQFLNRKREIIVPSLRVQWPVQKVDPSKCLYSQACSCKANSKDVGGMCGVPRMFFL